LTYGVPWLGNKITSGNIGTYIADLAVQNIQISGTAYLSGKKLGHTYSGAFISFGYDFQAGDTETVVHNLGRYAAVSLSFYDNPYAYIYSSDLNSFVIKFSGTVHQVDYTYM
jgi:hypothetical protein